MNLKMEVIASVLAIFQPAVFNADSLDKDEFVCMTENIFFETRASDHDDMVAVSNVVLNRVRDPRFEDSICGVVYEENQFSWTNSINKNDVNAVASKNILEKQALEESAKVALFATMRQIEDNTDGALFYHTHSVDPVWNDSMKVTAKTKNHVFMTDNVKTAKNE